LDEVEAVTVAAPTTLHHQIGMECLRRGVHILMEKPLAASVVDAHGLDDLAVPSGLVLQVGHVERFNPTFVELVNVLRDHQVLAVEARRLSPFATRAADVSVVYDLMVHDLDLILNLIDAPVRTIEATGSRIRSPQPDHALALLSFATGQVASLAASKITQHKVRQMAITCAEAFVVADLLSRTVMIYRQSAADYFAQRGEVLYRQEGLIEQVYVPQIEPLYAEVQHFLSCVRERRQPLVGSTDAIRVMTVADVIEERVLAGL
jgi:predicted dehydrogenase